MKSPSRELRNAAHQARSALLREDWPSVEGLVDSLIRSEPARLQWRMLKIDLDKARYDKESDPDHHYDRIKAGLRADAEANFADAMGWFELGYSFLNLTSSFALDEEELIIAEAAFARAREANSYCLAGYLGMQLAFNKRSIAGEHRYAEAIQVCRAAVDRLPDDPEAWFHLGEALNENYDVNMKPDALAAYCRAIELGADYTAAHFKTASLERIMGNLGAAVAGYRRVLAIDDQSTWAKDARRSLDYILAGPGGPSVGAAMPTPAIVPQFRLVKSERSAEPGEVPPRSSDGEPEDE